MTVVPGSAASRLKWRRWRLPLVVSLVVVVLLAATAVLVLRLRAEPEQPPLVWDQVMAMIEPDGTVSLEMARQAFALTVAPLPGVDTPAVRGDGRPRSVTLPVSWLLNRWDRLTPEQRAAAAAYVDPYGTREVQGAGRGPGVRVTPAASQGTTTMPCSFPDIPARAGGADELRHLRRLAADLGAAFRPAIALDADLQLCHARRDIERKMADGTTFNPGALTHWRERPVDGRLLCWIIRFPSGPHEPGAALDRALIHELAHCLQTQLMSEEPDRTVTATDHIPWVADGTAEWIASTLTGRDWDLPTYPEDPGKPLYLRQYDAVGFFTHLDDLRGDNWETLPEIIRASAVDGPTAFDTAVDGQRDEVLSRWPASWLLADERGPDARGAAGPWTMSVRGTGYTPYQPPSAGPVSSDHDPLPVRSDPWAAGLVKVDLQAELVFVSPRATGPVWGRFGPGPDGDFTLADAARRIFCTEPGGCACEDGSPLPTVGAVTDVPAGEAYVAVTGGRGSGEVRLQGVSVEDFCDDPQRYLGGAEPAPVPVPVPVGGCQGNCASSNGDPHLVTFDEHHYSVQAVGEFVLTRSRDDSLAVQARTAPVEGSRHASMNTALAMDVAGDRVGFYVEEDAVVARVDGAPATVPPAGTALAGGGTLSPVAGVAGAHRVAWPDGTTAWVTPVLPYGLSIRMGADPSRAGRLAGLLGDFDGDPANDLTTPDGQVLDLPASFDDLYPELADSWRVRAAESLFDYGPGEDTGTFTDRDFPAGSAPEIDRAAAEAICREAGVTDLELLENCVFDVGITGDPVFAGDTAQLQQFLDSAEAEPEGEADPPAGELPDPCDLYTEELFAQHVGQPAAAVRPDPEWNQCDFEGTAAATVSIILTRLPSADDWERRKEVMGSLGPVEIPQLGHDSFATQSGATGVNLHILVGTTEVKVSVFIPGEELDGTAAVTEQVGTAVLDRY